LQKSFQNFILLKFWKFTMDLSENVWAKCNITPDSLIGFFSETSIFVHMGQILTHMVMVRYDEYGFESAIFCLPVRHWEILFEHTFKEAFFLSLYHYILYILIYYLWSHFLEHMYVVHNTTAQNLGTAP
jgi:hypothetical protein